MPPNWLTNDKSNAGKGDPQVAKEPQTEENCYPGKQFTKTIFKLISLPCDH